jgi:putative tryptophan/tyrosine transport system substrate-binding protein
MRRREFIAGLGGAVVWPQVARAQPAVGIRRIGWLIGGADNDQASLASRVALQEALGRLGWIEGSNLRIDLRFGASNPDRMRAHAVELVGLMPDVLLANSGAPTRALQERTLTIPIVFTAGGDPVVDGLVRNIARPEGNTTGFSNYAPTIAGKWLELLKEAAPHLARVALIFNPELIPNTGPFFISSIEAAAPELGVQVIKAPVRNSVDIVRAIDAFAAQPKGGLLVLPPAPTTTIRDTIFQLTTQHRLPAIFTNTNRIDATAGGLIVYGPSFADRHRLAASYVDRLLRGAKVSDLPVQFPTKYELIVNLKAAKAIGLTIPQSFVLRADEVIE